VQHRHRARGAAQLLVVLAEGVGRGPRIVDDEFAGITGSGLVLTHSECIIRP